MTGLPRHAASGVPLTTSHPRTAVRSRLWGKPP